MMKDFGLHNALAFLATIVGLAVIGGVGLFFWRVADTWTPANTNFLTAAISLGCVLGMVILSVSLGGAVWGFSQRFGSGGFGRRESDIPAGFQIVDGQMGDGSVPQYPTSMPMLMDVPEEKAGSWNAVAPVEDAWE